MVKVHAIDLEFLGNTQAIAAYLVESEEGLVLVECGPYSTFSVLEKAVESLGFKLKDIKHVFLSHIHFDHAGAAWAFAALGAKVYVHPKGATHLAAPEKLYNSARMIYLDRMDELWGKMEPIPAEQLVAPAHGQAIEAIGLQWVAHYTPGHAVHHIAWELLPSPTATSTILFAGDVAGVKINEGPVMPPCPPPDINIEDWLESIAIMRALPVKVMYLTHYGKVFDTKGHLDALEKQLRNWAKFIKPYFDKQTPAEEIVPLFQAFVQKDLKKSGVAADGLARYEAANPAFMSVAGLMRYWTKKSR